MKKTNQILLSMLCCLGFSTALMGMREEENWDNPRSSVFDNANVNHNDDQEMREITAEHNNEPKKINQDINQDDLKTLSKTPSTRASTPIVESKPGTLQKIKNSFIKNFPTVAARFNMVSTEATAPSEEVTNNSFVRFSSSGNFLPDASGATAPEYVSYGDKRKEGVNDVSIASPFTDLSNSEATAARLAQRDLSMKIKPTPAPIDFRDTTILNQIANGKKPFDNESIKTSVQAYGSQAKADLINKIVNAELRRNRQAFYDTFGNSYPTKDELDDYNKTTAGMKQNLITVYRRLIDNKNELTYDPMTDRVTPITKYNEATRARMKLETKINNTNLAKGIQNSLVDQATKDFSTKTIISRLKNGESLQTILGSDDSIISKGLRSYGVKAKEKFFNDILNALKNTNITITQLRNDFQPLLRQDNRTGSTPETLSYDSVANRFIVHESKIDTEKRNSLIRQAFNDVKNQIFIPTNIDPSKIRNSILLQLKSDSRYKSLDPEAQNELVNKLVQKIQEDSKSAQQKAKGKIETAEANYQKAITASANSSLASRPKISLFDEE